MSLRQIESDLSQLVIELHDMARACTDPAVTHHLRRVAHEVSLVVDHVRRLLTSREAKP